MDLYKWLNHDGTPCHGGTGQWPLPTDTAPGDWLAVKGEIKPCQNGLHLCRERDLVSWIGPVLYRVEHDGEMIECENKVVVRRARLLSRVDSWTDATSRLFACRCVRETPLHDGRTVWDLLTDDRSREAVAVAERFAAGEATSHKLATAYANAYSAISHSATAYAPSCPAASASSSAAASAFSCAGTSASSSAAASASASAAAAAFSATSASYESASYAIDASAAARDAQYEMVQEIIEVSDYWLWFLKQEWTDEWPDLVEYAQVCEE